jgi:hypothetical protein
MIDIHPPHQPTHTWRDFFIHIATICVGLLIAIGLEQTVEHIHVAHEARDLRESLARETDKIIKDSEDADAGLRVAHEWDKKVLQQISDAGLQNQPLGALPSLRGSFYLIAADPVYSAAKASGQLSLLTREEVQAYSEVDTIIEDNKLTRQEVHREDKLLNDFVDAESFAQPSDTPPFAHASHDELRQYYDLFVSASAEHDRYRRRLRHAWAAEVAISQGERDLDKIEAAESQFDRLP